MMSELISKNKAITALVFSEETKDIKCGDMKKVLNVLKKLPSAESEIIHCKNCKHRESNDCPMYYEEWIEIDEGDGYFDTDNIIHDWTTDEGFCYFAELRGKEE